MTFCSASIRRPTNMWSIQKNALLVEAETNVKQLKAALDQAQANVEKVKVQLKLAEDELLPATLFVRKEGNRASDPSIPPPAISMRRSRP